MCPRGYPAIFRRGDPKQGCRARVQTICHHSNALMLQKKRLFYLPPPGSPTVSNISIIIVRENISLTETGDVKASVAELPFILCSAAKYNVDGESRSNELQQFAERFVMKFYIVIWCWFFFW